MSFKIGDSVFHKSNLEIEFIVAGFASSSSESSDIYTTPGVWVVCRLVKLDGTVLTSVFHEEELAGGEDI